MSPDGTVCAASGGASREQHRGSTAGAAFAPILFPFGGRIVRGRTPDGLRRTNRSLCAKQIYSLFRSVRLAPVAGNLPCEIARFGAQNSSAHGLDDRPFFPAGYRPDDEFEVKVKACQKQNQ